MSKSISQGDRAFSFTVHVRRFLPYNVRYLGTFLDPLTTLKADVIYGRSLKERQSMLSNFRVHKKGRQNDPKNQTLWGTNRRVW